MRVGPWRRRRRLFRAGERSDDAVGATGPLGVAMVVPGAFGCGEHSARSTPVKLAFAWFRIVPRRVLSRLSGAGVGPLNGSANSLGGRDQITSARGAIRISDE